MARSPGVKSLYKIVPWIARQYFSEASCNVVLLGNQAKKRTVTSPVSDSNCQLFFIPLNNLPFLSSCKFQNLSVFLLFPQCHLFLFGFLSVHVAHCSLHSSQGWNEDETSCYLLSFYRQESVRLHVNKGCSIKRNLQECELQECQTGELTDGHGQNCKVSTLGWLLA